MRILFLALLSLLCAPMLRAQAKPCGKAEREARRAAAVKARKQATQFRLEAVKALPQDTAEFKVYSPNKEMIQILSALPKLKTLTIHAGTLCNETLEPLGENKTITKLQISGTCCLFPSTYAIFAKMTQLTSFKDKSE